MRQPGFGGQIPTDCIELPVSQRADQVASDRDLVSVTSSKPLACQGIDPPIQCGADLGAETRPRKLERFSGDQPPVEPGRPFSRHLLIKAKIRAHCERYPRPPIRVLKAAQFNDAADRARSPPRLSPADRG